ncbi:uncharacterized protein [Cebidichthys violaceus]|uniref:uncharacterized protein n=1 Tax=Cebidichthys violaceus TaxID=271503 RepID=UPI0035CA6D5F
MSTRLGEGGRRGRGGRDFFLSTHRCPEVDLLPHHDSKTQIPPPCSLVPVKSSEFTCTGQSEAKYLDDSSICHSDEEDEERSISDWSEEDLSFHFSPSVILPSEEEEESDPESGFECIDVTMETQAVKMVPKRLIQLKKKKNAEKLQVILKDEPAHYPDLLLRQHSMPASFHTHSTTSSDVDGNGFYKGSQAPRLLKSFSLDETKTKMASCIIKDILSKKMQVEQNNCQSFHLQKKPARLPGLPQPAEQQRVREGERGETSCLGGETGRSVFKAPVHVVRDMRNLVKNTYSLSFSTTPENNKPTSFKLIGQNDSPPPTYQQAVGIRRQPAKVTASLSQSENRQHSDRFSRPITEQRRGSGPIVSRRKVDDVTCPTNPPISRDLSQFSQSERGRGVRHQAGTSPPSIQPPLSVQQQTMLGVSSQSAPSSSKQILHSCFYPPTLHPHLEKVMNSPLSNIHPQPPQPVLTHLLRRSEEIWSSGNTSDHLDQQSNGNTLTPATQKQHEQQTPQQQLQQQHFLCRVQGFLPAQVGSDFLVDIPPGAILSGIAPCHMMLEPKSGRLYVDTPPPPQRKMLLDTETGQYIQVLLPAARSFPHTDMIPVLYAKPAPVMISSTPPVLSVMQFQPTVAVSSVYTTAYYPTTYYCTPHQLTSHIHHT